MMGLFLNHKISPQDWLQLKEEVSTRKEFTKMIKATFLHASSKAWPIKITCILKAETISSKQALTPFKENN